MRTASRPALRPPPMPTVATGTPAGIWTIDSRLSRPSSRSSALGTPMTGSGVAAATPLPVIGVPRPLDRLDGLDSLLSIVQMPAGVPVATVSVGGARNAGLLAVRILAAGADDAAAALRERMTTFQEELRAAAEAKGTRLRARRAQGGAGF